MSRIEQGWYNGSALNYLLLPLSLLFWLVSSLRRLLYKVGLSKSFKAQRPVIIVGNISVGGNGKTPFVIWLVDLLQGQNIKVGVISRGYGGNSSIYPIAVDSSMDTAKFGDEPVLIHKRTGCPVVVGSDRVKSCEMLVSQFDCDVIISDDGMQHYRLQRDIEVAIVDAAREFGNGWVLPVGPLRELTKRLKSVDYVVYNGFNKNEMSYELQAGAPVCVQTDELIPGHHIEEQPIHAVCGIGNPSRFEQTVKDMNIKTESFTAFADHHQFSANDFNEFGAQPVVMTEKDAVKCQAFAKPNWWYIPVNAVLPQAFEKQLLTHIKQVIDNGI
jgi:tetraacyldisaccharide 4'-kinase